MISDGCQCFSKRIDCNSKSSLLAASDPSAINSSVMRSWSAASSTRGGPVKFGSEEHTSELQSLMRISYAVFCLKKKTHTTTTRTREHTIICTMTITADNK